MINPKDYPLTFLNSVSHVFTQVRNIIESNKDIIELVEAEDFKMVLKDKDFTSNFRFIIHEAKFEKSVASFTIEFNPTNSSSLVPRKVVQNPQGVKSSLDIWVNLIKHHNKVKIHPEDDFVNHYQEEFENWFAVDEDDADTAPFDQKRQVLIDNILEAAIKVLKDNADISDQEDLIQEAQELRKKSASQTKNQTVDALGKLYAKIRKRSIPVLKEIWRELKSFGYQKLLNSGYDDFIQFLS